MKRASRKQLSNRRIFIDCDNGAICLDWASSLAFVNREKKFVIMGKWGFRWTQMDAEWIESDNIIFKDIWRNETVEAKFFDEVVVYLHLVADGVFDLYMFEMWPLGSLEEPGAFHSFKEKLIKVNVLRDESSLCWRVEGEGFEKYRQEEEFARKRAKLQSKCEEYRSHLSWLQNSISVKEAEEKYMVEMNDRKIPFGYMHSAWITLLDKMQEGDELCEFQSTDKSWEQQTGREGIALVRMGVVIGEVATRMN